MASSSSTTTTKSTSSSSSSSSSTFAQRLGSAAFYAFCSFFIVVVNKLVLTSHKFPSEVLALGQICATIVILFLSKLFQLIEYPDLSMSVISKVFPLPLFYFANLLCGLGSTKRLNLPMFTVLRRFSILMTMLLEQYMLGNKRRWEMQISVYMMITGAMIAASDDLSYNSLGYLFVFINDLATALNGVYTMKKLESKSLGKYGILFYNALISLIPTALVTASTGGLQQAWESSWSDVIFVSEFALSCFMGFILNYSVVICTQHNSALTTTIVGVLKNIIITYAGMFIGGDYIFSALNFVGLNISAAASITYSYFEFISKKKPTPASSSPPSTPKPADPSALELEAVSTEKPTII